ncbi:hypothetical protein A2774_00170 [Candidatus Roizmanbacteria bacterium RIFCSPHIGHO2_01_FULL_39_12c]|uniref:DUF192 domain-containing protein n=1 Tax=Candidatus Roizmanbacteria bacterium RIFCSPHIGHO2_01_FULL_39_12c TaxID=1802031 RepID=A0A1F7GCH7_9BACT|nr:MAG: hypothetical protein A2774_00170 [Candidatus Roizmanbacteria bacterium RIFCSPHIGHO2_01_FULL_39_12c]
MKKLFPPILLGIFILLGLVLFINYGKNADKYKVFKKIFYKLEDKNLRLLVADTPEKWQKGLMYFRTLEGVDGMIFIFPDSEIRTFWNKNTYMDLDIYWINGDKVVGKNYLPSIEQSKRIVTVSSPEPADKVIEIPERLFF